MSMTSGLRNMAVLFGVMSYMKNIDQEDPKIIFIARCVFATYLIVNVAIAFLLYMIVTKKNDTRIIKVPKGPEIPSLFGGNPRTETADAASNPDTNQPAALDVAQQQQQDREKDISIRDYDLEQLAIARKGFLINAVMLIGIHIKMGAISPLIMTSVMGFMKYLDDPMIQIHIFKFADEGKLKRPFKPEPSLLGSFLNPQAQNPANSDNTNSSQTQSTTTDVTTDTSTQQRLATEDSSPAVQDDDEEEDTNPQDLDDDALEDTEQDKESKKDK